MMPINMAERIARIGTSPEVLNKFAKEALQSTFFAKLIANRDQAIVADALIEAGLMQEGDTLAVTFVVDTKLRSDSMSKQAKVYTACKTLEGKMIPTSFLGEFTLDIEFDRDN
jgi:hypothetical protein